MDLYDAIIRRQSIRKFEERSIPQDVLNTILDYAKNVERLDDSIEIGIEIVECKRRLFGAPYYLVLFSEKKDGYERNAGYIMQQIAIYLTVMGVGTCYQAKPSSVSKRDPKGRKRIISLAFGYTKEELFRDVLTASRLTQPDICKFREEPGANIYKIIEAVRMAPSSYNIQPWRMIVSKDTIHLFVTKTKIPFLVKQEYNEINIGVALANIMMTADNQWIDIKKKYIQALEDKKYKNLKYIVSIKSVTDNNI